MHGSLALAVVANTSGHSYYDAEQVCTKLTEVCKAPGLKFDRDASMAWPTNREWAELKKERIRVIIGLKPRLPGASKHLAEDSIP